MNLQKEGKSTAQNAHNERVMLRSSTKIPLNYPSESVTAGVASRSNSDSLNLSSPGIIRQSAVLYRDVITCIIQFMPFCEWHTAIQISGAWRDAIASLKPQRLTFHPSRLSFPQAATVTPSRTWIPSSFRSLISYWPFRLLRYVELSPMKPNNTQPTHSTLGRHIETLDMSRLSNASQFASLELANEVLKHLSIFPSLQCISSLAITTASAVSSFTLPATLTELDLGFEYKSMHEVTSVIGSLPRLITLRCSLAHFPPRYDNSVPPSHYLEHLEQTFEANFRQPLKPLRAKLQSLAIHIVGEDEDAPIHAAICKSVVEFSTLHELQLFDEYVRLTDLTCMRDTTISMPQLQHMRMQHTRMTKPMLECLHQIAPNLTILKPSSFQFQATEGTNGLDLNSMFPHLTQLSIRSMSVMSIEEAMSSFSNCFSLLELKIDAVCLAKETLLAHLLPRFPHLRKLSLRVRELHSFDCITQSIIAQTLTHLSLKGLWGLSSDRTEEELRKLSRLSSLESLQLVDIYDWKQEFWPFGAALHLFEHESPDCCFKDLKTFRYSRE